ncbi:hypothetical protein D043_5094, partial [Vibrio parahaemolyticus EKP-021]
MTGLRMLKIGRITYVFAVQNKT